MSLEYLRSFRLSVWVRRTNESGIEFYTFTDIFIQMSPICDGRSTLALLDELFESSQRFV